MWFAHDLLQPGVPTYNVIVCSWPIIVIVVPLLESELAIDPSTVKVCDEVIDVAYITLGLLFKYTHCNNITVDFVGS